ncbi:MAG: pitrilysin family protein [Sphingomonadaceae bacterium]
MILRVAVAFLAAVSLTTAPAAVARTRPAAVAAAPLPALVEAVSIPYETFTLDNGLRVVVHTDRKTPMVAVSVWYGVGSADEPAGKTGFAHLFEHLMFNGSGNWDAEFFEPLEDVGATSYNGTTWYDRTNYFQNVPTGALDLALFLEADRMGNLLPAVTQAKLDNQRGVVQNEKRQGDNQPYGLTFYALSEGLFPEGHPYRHSTIGSMADLDAASMEDVRAWFQEHYGPNNAVLVLAGDIDLVTAKEKVTRWFGAIPRGPEPKRPQAPLPTGQDMRLTLNDRVPNAQIVRAWTGPGLLDPASTDLSVAVSVLAGGQSSRLYNDLVRDRQLAVNVAGAVMPFRLASIAYIGIDVRPGVDPAQVEARVDELLAEFRRRGPTADEVARVATVAVAGRIRGLEQIGGFGGKAVALAEGTLYADDPGFYRKKLRQLAEASPRSVGRAARDWLSGPGVRLLTVPGERGARELALVGESGVPPADAGATMAQANPDRSKLPPVERREGLDFPDVERARLSNGIPVVFARRSAVPVVEVMASFDAGTAADRADRPGTQSLMLNLLREGTTSRSGRQIAEETERLGARLSLSAGQDRTRVSVSALAPNLRPTLALMADVVRNPAFAPAEVERLRAIQLNGIAQEEANPSALAGRELAARVFGADHPYGRPASGTREGVQAVTRDDLLAFHASWIRPDSLTLFAVGDTTLEALLPELEQAFGDWQPPAAPRGEKRFPPMRSAAAASILLLDRPNSPQSAIAAGKPLPLTGRDDRLDLEMANEALGGAFTSRLNMDLREAKGWSYGVRSAARPSREQMRFTIQAPVQSDKTGASIQAIVDNVRAFASTEPVRPEDLSRLVNSQVYALPGQFETSVSVLSALESQSVLGLPDDYFERVGARYRALDQKAVTQAATLLDASRMQWVVVGDASVVRPQLEALGLPLEVRPAPGTPMTMGQR